MIVRIVRFLVVATLVLVGSLGELAPMHPAAAVAQPHGPTRPQPPELSDTEVARLFDAPLPALSEPLAVPAITGNAAADRRIARLALARGYRPRGEPLDGLGWYQGRQLHQRAIDDLVALQAAMRAEVAVSLTVTSAHRSVSTQRGLFLRRLGVSAQAIADGRGDGAVDLAMRWVAPPGFSKHQTGYAIDVASGGVGGLGFASTTAYRWLSADRYANAMRFGWIPSYPPAAVAQGPNPEPWEWVWIGRTAAACARTRSCPVGEVAAATSGRRVRLDGWAVGSGAFVPRLRLVTASGNRVLGVRRVDRFDVTDVYGTDLTRVGFSARPRMAPGARWFCIEVRPRGGRWQRLSCQVR